MTDGSEQCAHHSERPQKAKNATRTVKPASTFGAWFLSVSGSSSRRILARTRSMSSRVVTAASQIGQPKPLLAARRGSRNPRLSKLIAEPTSSPTQFSPRIHYDASFSSSLVTSSSQPANECYADCQPSLFPPAKISCRPCSSYHLVRLAVTCIFSTILRQPMPVLYAQKEISPCWVAYGMMHCSVRRKS